MRGASIAVCCLAFLGTAAPAVAATCRNPQALGTSRTITIAPGEYTKLGDVHYSQFPQLPLRDHEVVLTFDDGPLSPFSDTILDALAHDCVKATFFLIGRQATAFPAIARRIYNDGHTIGTHSQNHPLTFDQMPLASAQREIDDGIASVTAALGDPRAVAPFFRMPGFLRVASVEDYLNSRAITVWSTDVDADDWYKNATPQDIVTKAMTRLEAKKHGILLLHDVHPATAMAVPMLLQELKSRGYKIVQVVPAGRRPKTLGERVASPAQRPQGWPRVTRVQTRWRSSWR
jgi:peptidoglycan/xylan/chitin deacetylase (PgdA/CDA1 family)